VLGHDRRNGRRHHVAKHMMGAASGTLSGFHSYFTNATTPALSLLNSQQVLKSKQSWC